MLGLAVWLATVEAVAFTPPRSFPDTWDTIRVYTDQLAGGMTTAQKQFAATHYVGTQKLLAGHIDEGTRQLRSGEYHEYDEAGLRALFDDIQARGQARYTAGKGES